MNTKITYLYRDADNYKAFNECVINGILTKQQQERICACLNCDEYFIPSQVGLPEKRIDDEITEADHCWFELDKYDFEDVDEVPTIDVSPEALVDAFENAKDNWNEFDFPLVGEMLLNNINLPLEGDFLKIDDKKVISYDDFDYSNIKIGDYVEQRVVDAMMDCMPPACMRSDCSQMGEPYSHKEDPETGQFRSTYSTFKKVSPVTGDYDRNAVWEWCGYCFRGENVERGKEPVHIGSIYSLDQKITEIKGKQKTGEKTAFFKESERDDGRI